MRNLVTNNLGLKAVSIAIAILLEIYYYSPDNSVELPLTATVEITNVPPSMMVVSIPPGSKGTPVNFTVKGPRFLVQQIKATPQKILVDVPPTATESFDVELEASQFNIPSGVELISLDPKNFVVRLEPVVSKSLVVVLDSAGEVAAGYRLEEVITPDTVNARGPKSELDGLSVVETEKLDIGNIKDSKSLNLELVPKGPFTQLDPRTVKVDLKVSPIPAEKTLSKVKVKVIAAVGVAALVDPAVVEATVSGPSAIIDSLKASDIELLADATPFTSGRHTITLSGRFPTGVTLAKATPGVVNVTIVSRP